MCPCVFMKRIAGINPNYIEIISKVYLNTPKQQNTAFTLYKTLKSRYIHRFSKNIYLILSKI